jgi:hypothetical protein
MAHPSKFRSKCIRRNRQPEEIKRFEELLREFCDVIRRQFHLGMASTAHISNEIYCQRGSEERWRFEDRMEEEAKKRLAAKKAARSAKRAA